MSATQALDRLFIGALGGEPWGTMLATLAAVAVYVVAVIPRLSPRAAAWSSGLIALAVVVVGGTLLAIDAVTAWPAWPVLVALLFSHLGMASARAAAKRPAARPPTASSAATASTPGAPAVPPPASKTALPGITLPPDRATLGRYRIDRQLGRGSMGAVYLGHDPKIGRQVAIKTMALSQEFDGAELVEARARFFREAETAGRLQHRDIVTIFDAGEDQGLAYIAMEYLKGHDLQRYTAAAQLIPIPAVLNVVARVADALAYAHNHGVVHRDIKPANVMVDPAVNSVKVTDFGIARITDSSRTRTGMVLGTPSFMSPEQMAGRRVDGRSDLYSLGVMLYQLLTGRLPHSADSMAKLMYQIANEPAPDVRGVRPDVPETLANVVALALEKRPEVRYADGRQMALDLRAIAAAYDPTAVAMPWPGAPAEAATPQSDEFAATVKLDRTDPRHNSPP